MFPECKNIHSQNILLNLFQSGLAEWTQEEADEDDVGSLLRQQLEAFSTPSSTIPISKKTPSPTPVALFPHRLPTHGRRAGFRCEHEALLQGLWGQRVPGVHEVRKAMTQEENYILVQFSPKQICDKVRCMLKKEKSLKKRPRKKGSN